jgi:hypothetical protein
MQNTSHRHIFSDTDQNVNSTGDYVLTCLWQYRFHIILEMLNHCDYFRDNTDTGLRINFEVLFCPKSLLLIYNHLVKQLSQSGYFQQISMIIYLATKLLSLPKRLCQMFNRTHAAIKHDIKWHIKEDNIIFVADVMTTYFQKHIPCLDQVKY